MNDIWFDVLNLLVFLLLIKYVKYFRILQSVMQHCDYAFHAYE